MTTLTSKHLLPHIFIFVILTQSSNSYTPKSSIEENRIVNLTHFMYPKLKQLERTPAKRIPDPCLDYRDAGNDAKLLENSAVPIYVKNVILRTIHKFKKYNFHTGKFF